MLEIRRAILWLLLCYYFSAAQQQEQQHQVYDGTHFLPGRNVIVELRNYRFVDIAKECVDFLGPKGYAGVQVSPVTEHLRAGSDEESTQSWLRYQPISYELTSESGGKDEFLTMTKACNGAGVRVYVSVILNHMAGYMADNNKSTNATQDLGVFGTNGSLGYPLQMRYPSVPYTRSDFHKPCQLLPQSLDAHEVRNCQVNGCPDLDHSRENVYGKTVKLLNSLVKLGAAGFHIEAARHMWPMDLKRIYKAVQNLSVEFDFPAQSRPFYYQDVYDVGNGSVSKTEYIGYGAVSEYLYIFKLLPVFKGNEPLNSLINWGPAMGFVSHADALVFVNDPASDWETTYIFYKQRYLRLMLFMLFHPFGRLKRISTESRCADVNTSEADEDPKCVHRWPAVVNALQVVNSLDDELDGVINFQTHGPQQICFCRGNKAFIVINNDQGMDYVAKVRSCFTEPGVYCDVITGGRSANGRQCHGVQVRVKNDEGDVDLNLPQSSRLSLGMLAIYVDSKLIVDDDDDVETQSGADNEAGYHFDIPFRPLESEELNEFEETDGLGEEITSMATEVMTETNLEDETSTFANVEEL